MSVIRPITLAPILYVVPRFDLPGSRHQASEVLPDYFARLHCNDATLAKLDAGDRTTHSGKDYKDPEDPFPLRFHRFMRLLSVRDAHNLRIVLVLIYEPWGRHTS